MLEGGISTGQELLREGLATNNVEEALLILVYIISGWLWLRKMNYSNQMFIATAKLSHL